MEMPNTCAYQEATDCQKIKCIMIYPEQYEMGTDIKKMKIKCLS